MTAPLPDLIGALISRTQALPNTAALVGKRVSGRLRVKSQADPNGWDLMPRFAIVYRMMPGPVFSRTGTVPVRQQPVQMDCYGADLRLATQLWRTVHAELFPDPPDSQSFIAAGCAVMGIQEMGAPAALREADSDFPRVVSTYLVTYSERPVA